MEGSIVLSQIPLAEDASTIQVIPARASSQVSWRGSIVMMIYWHFICECHQVMRAQHILQDEPDPILMILSQDTAFIDAVQQQDVDSAARAAFEVLKVRPIS